MATDFIKVTTRMTGPFASYTSLKKKKSLNTLLLADVYTNYFFKNSGWRGRKGCKTDRNCFEGNIDLSTVQVTEMPWKELLRSLWLSSPSACFTHSALHSDLPKL